MGQEQSPLKEFTDRSTYEIVVHRISDEGLREFIRGFCDGRIFTSAQISEHEPHMLPMIFTPICLGMFRDHTPKEIEEKAREIGVFWEWIDQSAPRSINGYPIFFSCRVMHVDDWRRALPAIQEELGRREAIHLPPRDAGG